MHEPKITFALFKDVLRPQMNGEKLAAEKEENMRTQVIIENFTKNNLDVLVQNYERSVKFLNHRTPKLIFLLQNNESLYEKIVSAIDDSLSSNSRNNEIKNVHFDQKDQLDDLKSQDAAGDDTKKWNIVDNPLMALCNMSNIDSKAPPLFALRFPDLFIY